MRQASLIAGVGILLGALALVRPWGLRPPRWLIVIPALTGSAWAAAHALTAYLTKPLHLLGVIQLDFRGWSQLSEGALIRSTARPPTADAPAGTSPPKIREGDRGAPRRRAPDAAVSSRRWMSTPAPTKIARSACSSS